MIGNDGDEEALAAFLLSVPSKSIVVLRRDYLVSVFVSRHLPARSTLLMTLRRM
jgi:hypothetical protein